MTNLTETKRTPPADVCDIFWLGVDNLSKDAILRDLELAPDGDRPLTLQERRMGLLASAEKRKITKFRAALNAALPDKRGRGRPAFAAPAISAKMQLDAAAVAANTGFLLCENETWKPANFSAGGVFTDAVVQAAIKSGWLQSFRFNNSDNEFDFVIITPAGTAALEAPA